MYQRAYDINFRSRKFALEVINLVSRFPKQTSAFVIGKQLIRSATSIGANLAEASAARSKIEFCSTLGISLKEGQETIFWLRLASESGLLESACGTRLIKEVEEISSIIGRIIINTRSKIK